jgi:hypothetical protein
MKSNLKREQGFVLPLVLIALLFVSLLIIPFLDFARLRFGSLGLTISEEERYFTADAGIEAVLADLRKGSDVLDAGYVIPAVFLNGYTADISVASPTRDAYVPFGAVFVDPQTEASLSPLAGNGDFLYTIENVKTNSDFQASWVFTPPDNGWQMTVFEGEGTGGSQLGNATKNASPARITIDNADILGGTYTIRFRNKSSNALTSAVFSSIGDPSSTWVRLIAWKDYVVTSTVEDTTISVFARQGPGPNQVQSTVSVFTWHGPN